MKKIVYIPLDERPCNYDFPVLLGKLTENYYMVTPPMEIMGNKKNSANIEEIWKWLENEIIDAQGAILSIDTLVYGGIVPSRLHYFDIEECNRRLLRLKKIKAIKNIPIYGFSLIMRCPEYSSNDEEPDYYEEWGREIFRVGFIEHKNDIGIASEEEKKEFEDISLNLPEEIMLDYIKRRKINREVNRLVIDYVRDGVIDFLIIPQDDSAPFGLTALDQMYLRKYIEKNNMDLKVYMYPGADEVGCTLLARFINKMENKQPLVYIRYSSVKGPFIIPLYEDRYLYETVKYQVLAAGGLLASSLYDGDIVVIINSPGEAMTEASEQMGKNPNSQVNHNPIEIVEFADFVISKLKKPVVFADVAYANGADLKLIRLLKSKKMLFKLGGYAGWNTSSNTLGTSISQGMLNNIYGNSINNREFLALRYVEDAGYCSFARNYVYETYASKMGYSLFELDGVNGEISKLVKKTLEKYIVENLNYDEYVIEIEKCYMPWNRMFETGIKVKINK